MFLICTMNLYHRQFLLTALSGDDTGRILRYNPLTKEVKVLYKEIQFPNGLSLSKDESFLVVAQTTTCRLAVSPPNNDMFFIPLICWAIAICGNQVHG